MGKKMGQRGFAKTICTFVFLMAIATSVSANPLDFYGFTARASAMGSAFTAIATDPSGLYYNPAAIALGSGNQVSVGFMAAFPDLKLKLHPAPDATLEEKKRLDDLEKTQSDVPLVDGAITGVTIKANEYFYGGASVFWPIGELVRVKPLDSRLPSFVMHSSRTQRIVVLVGGAVKPIPNLSFGAAASLFLHVFGDFSMPVTLDNSNVSLDPNNPPPKDIPNRVDLTVELPLTVWPQFGVAWKPLDWLNLGLSYRSHYELDVGIDLDADIMLNNYEFNLKDLEKIAPDLLPMKIVLIMDLPFLSDKPIEIPVEIDELSGTINISAHAPIGASIYFAELWQPQQASFGAGFNILSNLTFTADVTWYDWSEYPAPDVKIKFDDIHLNLSTLPTTITGRIKSVTIPILGTIGPLPPVDISIPGISATIDIPLKFEEAMKPRTHDTFVPRAGVEYKLPRIRGHGLLEKVDLAIRGGYGFMPSPFEKPDGLSNLIDCNTHMFTTGLGVEFGPNLALDIFAQYFLLEPLKADRLAIDSYYPYDSIEAGGQIFAGGLNAMVRF